MIEGVFDGLNECVELGVSYILFFFVIIPLAAIRGGVMIEMNVSKKHPKHCDKARRMRSLSPVYGE